MLYMASIEAFAQHFVYGVASPRASAISRERPEGSGIQDRRYTVTGLVSPGVQLKSQSNGLGINGMGG